MLVGYLATYANSCRQADMSDAATRLKVQEILIPRLAGHRRQLTLSILAARGKGLTRLRKGMLADVVECKTAIRMAQARIQAATTAA